jgi:hypothetical protein
MPFTAGFESTGYAVKLSENIAGLEFLEFKIQDQASGEVFFEVRLPELLKFVLEEAAQERAGERIMCYSASTGEMLVQV